MKRILFASMLVCTGQSICGLTFGNFTAQSYYIRVQDNKLKIHLDNYLIDEQHYIDLGMIDTDQLPLTIRVWEKDEEKRTEATMQSEFIIENVPSLKIMVRNTDVWIMYTDENNELQITNLVKQMIIPSKPPVKQTSVPTPSMDSVLPARRSFNEDGSERSESKEPTKAEVAQPLIKTEETVSAMELMTSSRPKEKLSDTLELKKVRVQSEYSPTAIVKPEITPVSAKLRQAPPKPKKKNVKKVAEPKPKPIEQVKPIIPITKKSPVISKETTTAAPSSSLKSAPTPEESTEAPDDQDDDMIPLTEPMVDEPMEPLTPAKTVTPLQPQEQPAVALEPSIAPGANNSNGPVGLTKNPRNNK